MAVHGYICASHCMCVSGRWRERLWDSITASLRWGEEGSYWACVCVCVRERQTEANRAKRKGGSYSITTHTLQSGWWRDEITMVWHKGMKTGAHLGLCVCVSVFKRVKEGQWQSGNLLTLPLPRSCNGLFFPILSKLLKSVMFVLFWFFFVIYDSGQSKVVFPHHHPLPDKKMQEKKKK